MLKVTDENEGWKAAATYTKPTGKTEQLQVFLTPTGVKHMLENWVSCYSLSWSIESLYFT